MRNRSISFKRFLIFLVLFTLAVISPYYLLTFDAGATGGAYRYTKHGATQPGENNTQNGGVDRSVTGQWPPSSEAGTYKKGECTHCHEPHASFGGSEPYPNATNYPSFMSQSQAQGPSPYLLFSNAHERGFTAEYGASFCWTCHENLTLNSNPTGWGYYAFYQGRDIFLNGPHWTLGWSGLQWPGEPPNGGTSTIHPRNPRSGFSAPCLHCHTPHGIKAEDAASAYDTWAVPASRQTVASGNPAVTADYLIPHQLIAWEEALCENCHDSSGPAMDDIKTEIDKRTLVGGSGHPVDDTSLAGRHFVGESLPVTTKHVECYDCHNPHAEFYNCGGGQGYFSGMRYIDINGNVQDPCPKGARQPYIHEVCFKCHGDSYNQVFQGNAYPDDTIYRPDGRSNKRLEFDPCDSCGSDPDPLRGPNQNYNSAYHPVAQAGRNNSAAIRLQLLGGLTPTSTINCTDCHNSESAGGVEGPVTKSHLRTTDVSSNYTGSQPIGPHGSQIITPTLNFNSGVSDNGDRSILRDYYFTGTLPLDRDPFNSPSSTTEFQDRFKLCFNCHDWNTFYGNNDNTNFYGGGGGGMGGMGGGGMGGGNLHALHLNGTGGMGWGPTYEACMTCHYNVHSNVQATNTLYDTGAGLPPDGDTHLVNFAPDVVTGYSYSKPAWYYSGGQMNCNLRCHGRVMTYSYNCSHSNTSTGETTDTCNDF